MVARRRLLEGFPQQNGDLTTPSKLIWQRADCQRASAAATRQIQPNRSLAAPSARSRHTQQEGG